MYGYIYKTINLLNGMIYIGQKKSPKFLGNAYLGSGKLLRKAVKKYGHDNFRVELLESIESQEDMDTQEIFWIQYYNATDHNVGYNISEGGFVNRTMVGENNPFYGKHHTDKTNQINSEKHKGKTAWNKGLDKSDPRVAKYAVKLHKCTHARGRIWIYKDNYSKMVYSSEVQSFLQLGWNLGRGTVNRSQPSSLVGRKRINDGCVEKTVSLEELNSYKEQGWKLGRLPFKKRVATSQ